MAAEKTMTILVVDDDETNRDLLVLILKANDYNIVTAEDGRKALTILKSQKIDLVLLDLMMPVIDGYQVLRLMSADIKLQKIPVIIITAVGKMESVKHCINLGAKDYLLKPYNQDVVRNRIAAILAFEKLYRTEQTLKEIIEEEKRLSIDLMEFAVPASLKLAKECDYNKLVEKIVLQAMSYCQAEAGILYTRTRNNTLKFEVVRNKPLNIALGGSTEKPCPYQPVLIMSDTTSNEPNNQFAITRAVHQKKQINLDMEEENSDDSLFTTRLFNEAETFRAITFLITPIINPSGYVIGILELINALDPINGLAIRFNRCQEAVINTFCQVCSVMIETNHLHQQVNTLSMKYLNQISEK